MTVNFSAGKEKHMPCIPLVRSHYKKILRESEIALFSRPTLVFCSSIFVFKYFISWGHGKYQGIYQSEQSVACQLLATIHRG